MTQCRHYSNLLIAFVVCGVLLGTNVFMFTIIIFQNTIKLRILKNNRHFYNNRANPNINHQHGHPQFSLSSQLSSNYIEKSDVTGGEKSFLSADKNEPILCCSSKTLKSALSDSCNDIIGAICCNSFLERRMNRQAKVRPRLGKHRVQNFSGKSDLSRLNQSLSQSCTTITRPGYILQVPNTTISSSSSSAMNMSDANKTTGFSRSTIYSKSNFLNNNFNRNRSLAVFQQQQQLQQQQQQQQQNPNEFQNSKLSSQTPKPFNPTDKNLLNSTSCLDAGVIDNYDNEIFYHMPKKFGGTDVTSQISSAF